MRMETPPNLLLCLSVQDQKADKTGDIYRPMTRPIASKGSLRPLPPTGEVGMLLRRS